MYGMRHNLALFRGMELCLGVHIYTYILDTQGQSGPSAALNQLLVDGVSFII